MTGLPSLSHSLTHSSLEERFPGGSAVKNLPAVQKTQETQIQSLGLEGPLEEGVATHSSILVWGISWTQEHGWLHFMGATESWTWLK